MEKQIKEFLSLVTIGNTYIPFKIETRTNDDFEVIEEGTTTLASNTIETAYSYVSGINLEELRTNITTINNIKSSMRDNYAEIMLNPDKYKDDWQALIYKLKYESCCQQLEHLVKVYEEYEKELIKVPRNFVGTLVSNDLALVYRDKTITGSIYLPNGQTAFISANIDEFGNIGMLDINVFDNIFDMAMLASYEDDGIGALISYNDIDKQIESLKGKGINPDLSMQIDFNQMLKERHHSDLKNYMVLIHIFKDTIIGKIQEKMQREKVKTK